MRIEDDFYEPTAQERYERNYARIFKEVVERKWPVAVPDNLYPPEQTPNRVPPADAEDCGAWPSTPCTCKHHVR